MTWWTLLLLIVSGLLGIFGKLGSFVDEFLLGPQDHERQLSLVQQWYLRIESARVPDFPRLFSAFIVQIVSNILGTKRFSIRRILIVLGSSWLLTTMALWAGEYMRNSVVSIRDPIAGYLGHQITPLMIGNRVLHWLNLHGLTFHYSIYRARLLGAFVSSTLAPTHFLVNLITDAATVFMTLFALKRVSGTPGIRSFAYLAGAFVMSGALAIVSLFLVTVLRSRGALSYVAQSVLHNSGNVQSWGWEHYFAITTFLPVSICLAAIGMMFLMRVSISSTRWIAFLFTKSAAARSAEQVKLWKAAGWLIDVFSMIFAIVAATLNVLRSRP